MTALTPRRHSLRLASFSADLGDATAADHFIASAVGFRPVRTYDVGASFQAMTHEDQEIYRGRVKALARKMPEETRRRQSVWRMINSLNA